ncbi:MAG TPA: serine hydrolase domain-containing protein [Acidimicrobiales bacterium]|nr:serine hydrolase domain-containing protein [Acidimicrobiales bacterium]
MVSHVERGAMPGLIPLVARRGRAHVDVIGAGAFGDNKPLSRDAIFRIASLTKPIAAVAAMMLIEDGVLGLDDTVDELLPELASRKVLRSLDAELDDTVPAVRPITVNDVLTFRLGFGNIMVPPSTYPIQRAEEELQLKSLGPPWPPTPHTPDVWIQRLGTLPLMYQPGERWLYDTGAQVLGVLIERAADKPLEAFLRERIFGPLGMDDTNFSVSPRQLGRLTTAYAPDPESGALGILDGVEGSYWNVPPAFPSAAAWLVSTIDDYWTFVQMMLNRGVHEGVPVISEASVELITTDQLTGPQRKAGRPILAEQEGWGLGLMAPAADRDGRGVPGGYGWNGGTGTTWRSDIDRDLTGILFTQRAVTSPEPPEVVTDFWNGAYQAIED